MRRLARAPRVHGVTQIVSFFALCVCFLLLFMCHCYAHFTYKTPVDHSASEYNFPILFSISYRTIVHWTVRYTMKKKMHNIEIMDVHGPNKATTTAEKGPKLNGMKEKMEMI